MELELNSDTKRLSFDQALRTLQQNHIQLSTMADIKANIMITVCSIVLTFSLTQVYKPVLQIHLSVLITFTLLALLLAVLAVIPSMKKPLDKDGNLDQSSSMFNLFFFMHFDEIPKDDFIEKMKKVLNDDTLLYEHIIADIYGNGIALSRKKYRLIRWSYLLFLAGILLSIITLGVDIFLGKSIFLSNTLG